jgi:hypothetical protein
MKRAFLPLLLLVGLAQAQVAPSSTPKPFFINLADAPYFAKCNNVNDIAPIVERAIAKIVAAGIPGIIAFPAGECAIRSTIDLPRTGWTNNIVIQYIGTGVKSTILSDSGTLGVNTPMWAFAQTPTLTSVGYHVFKDMMWQRSGDGRIFEHIKPTGDAVSERAVRLTFENLYIRGKASTLGALTKELMYIEGGIEIHLNKVSFDGGLWAAHFKDCSHMRANGIYTSTDTYCKNGFWIEGGGNNYWEGMRVEGTNGGKGVYLSGNVKNDRFEAGPTFEGKATSPYLDIDSADGVYVTSGAFGASDAGTEYGDTVGVRLGNNAKNVTIQNSRWSLGSGGDAIRAENGAAHIRGNDLFFFGGGAANIATDGGVKDALFQGYYGSNADNRFGVAYGYIGSVVTNISSLDVAEYLAFKLAMSNPTNLDNMTGGWEGQEMPLICTNANTVIRHDGDGGTGNIMTKAGTDITCASKKAYKFIFDGTDWLEL